MDFVIYVDMLSGAKYRKKKVAQARMMAGSHDAYDAMDSDGGWSTVYIHPWNNCSLFEQHFRFIIMQKIINNNSTNASKASWQLVSF